MEPLHTRRPAGTAAAFSVLAGAAFVLILAAFTVARFPREVALYRSRGEAPPGRVFECALEVHRTGPTSNLWRLEIELAVEAEAAGSYSLALNGAPLSPLASGTEKIAIEIPGSLLRDGSNTLRVEAPFDFACPRFRIVNVTAYAVGFVAADVFPKTNAYPGLPDWPATAIGWALVAVLGAAVGVLDFLSGRRREGTRGVLRVLRGSRLLIPVLFLAVAATPLVSRYSIRLGLRSVLAQAWIFLALAFAPDLVSSAGAAGRRIARLIRALAPDVHRAAARIPILRTWERALSTVLIAAYILIGLALPGPNQIRGDGVEYYAMTASLARFGTPYITPASAAYASGLIGRLPWMAPDEALYDWVKRTLGPLARNGTELDPTHFWFYSLLAAVFFWPLRLLGFNPAGAFVLLHIALLVLAFAVVRRKLGPTASACMLLLVFGSPLPWFITRPQVEIFTALLGIIAFACLIAEDYLPAAFAFAAAATQNPPFAVLAGLAFLFGWARKKRAILNWRTFPLWTAAGLLSLSNPAYYFLRYRILNPIVAAGAAKLGSDPYTGKKMISILFDPDIGLFPDWPLALVLLVALVILAARKKAGLKSPVWLFLGLFSLILLRSQASTQNINHGGTYHITRYALWYAPVFFLALWKLFAALKASKPLLRRTVMISAAALCLIQGWDYRPTRPETYLEQTRLSEFLYDRLPGLFDPHPEIFMERQTGMEESPPYGVWAVSNKSGNKILVMRDRLHYATEEGLPPVPYDLALDPVLVYKEALRRTGENREIGYFYINGMGAALRRRGR
jgi:hypothetical protein